MKSFFAHTALLSLTLVSAVAAARPAANLEAHLEATGTSQYLNADVKMNYRTKVLHLSLQAPTRCPEGRMCAMVMPEPVEYKFTRVVTKTNSCGIVTSTAVDDKIPVDGPRIEVNLHDNRANTCPTFAVLPATTMTVSQKHYDRINGGWVETLDAFASKESPFQGAYGAALTAVSSQTFTKGDVTVYAGQGEVKLKLVDKKKKTWSYNLSDAVTEIDYCGIIRTTAVVDANSTVTINYNRNNVCPTFAPLAALDVILTTTEGDNQDVDTFSAADVRLIKPAK